jgi:hypothetical protein
MLVNSELAAALRQALVFVLNVIGIVGGLLILYSILAGLSGSRWDLLEKYATPAADALTLLGTALTASSVYVRTNTRPPDEFSRYISAPMVLAAIVIAIWAWLWKGRLPPLVVTGFSLLAISGALFRLISR